MTDLKLLEPPAEVCPSCGSSNLYDVELAYEGTLGFRADLYGHTPELGDTISYCGDCAGFVTQGVSAAAVTGGTRTFSFSSAEGGGQ